MVASYVVDIYESDELLILKIEVQTAMPCYMYVVWKEDL